MQTAVSYARFSSSRQHESSIEAQQAAIREYAAAHDIRIVREYVDRAHSGTDAEHRPEFQNLIADLSAAPVDLVLVHKQDRFARNRYDAAIYSRLIVQRGARLVAVAQDFGSGPEAVILDSLMQAMAEYYSKNLAAEILKGRKESVKAGRHPAGMYPFGYESDGHGSYQIVELEAYYIRRLYDAVLTGASYRPILREMDAIGIHGRRGGKIWAANVSAMLRNPVYAGIYDQRAGNVRRRIENHHPAIVSKSKYEEVLKLLEKRQSLGRKNAKPYLCSGIAFCALCGQPLHAHSNKPRETVYKHYRCAKNCGLRSISARELDEAACAYVNALLQPQVVEQLTAAMRDYIAGQRREAKSRAPESRRQITALQKEIDAITKNLSSAVLPPPVVEALGKDMQAKMAQIAVLEELAKEPPPLTVPDVTAYFDAASSISPDGDYKLTRQMLRRFIRRIDVDQHTITITSTFDAWLKEHMADAPTLSQLSRLPSENDDTATHGGGSGSAPASGTPSAPLSSPPAGSSCAPWADYLTGEVEHLAPDILQITYSKQQEHAIRRIMLAFLSGVCLRRVPLVRAGCIPTQMAKVWQ